LSRINIRENRVALKHLELDKNSVSSPELERSQLQQLLLMPMLTLLLRELRGGKLSSNRDKFSYRLLTRIADYSSDGLR
jgi:hypothetical protein